MRRRTLQHDPRQLVIDFEAARQKWMGRRQCVDFLHDDRTRVLEWIAQADVGQLRVVAFALWRWARGIAGPPCIGWPD